MSQSNCQEMEAITVSRRGFCLHSAQEVTEELSSIGSLYHLITVVTGDHISWILSLFHAFKFLISFFFLLLVNHEYILMMLVGFYCNLLVIGAYLFLYKEMSRTTPLIGLVTFCQWAIAAREEWFNKSFLIMIPSPLSPRPLGIFLVLSF